VIKIKKWHEWRVSPAKASEIQKTLRPRVSLTNAFRDVSEIGLLAGCDIAVDPGKGMAYGAVAVYEFPGLREVERKTAVGRLTFPYVPGLLAFREAPVLLEAIAALEHEPDLYIFDGQGIAHPRGMGIASHLGLFLEKPAIGCAKSRLCGMYREPGLRAGDHSVLLTREGERIGSVLRTRDRVKPVFVSPGHLIDFGASAEIILKTTDGYRIPKPTREADRYTKILKRESAVRNRKTGFTGPRA